jgi:hypothetical protein
MLKVSLAKAVSNILISECVIGRHGEESEDREGLLSKAT